MQAGADAPLVLLYARLGYLHGHFWFSEADNDNVFVDEYKSYSDVRAYYSNMGEDYERLHRGWGWCLPDVGAAVVANHLGIKVDAKVLDLGTGDGLTGWALAKRGFSDITGVDFSEQMLKEAAKRGCYGELKLADLLQPLPFDEESFDVLICTGVTSMLG
jgi:predicted TPR repeat methyltransferase